MVRLVDDVSLALSLSLSHTWRTVDIIMMLVVVLSIILTIFGAEATIKSSDAACFLCEPCVVSHCDHCDPLVRILPFLRNGAESG